MHYLSKKSYWLILVLFIPLFLASCGDEEDRDEVKPEFITINSPSNETVFVSDYPNLIAWNSTFSDNVDIELWKDDEKLLDIAKNAPNTSEYEWNIDELNSESLCSIKIIRSSDPQVFSMTPPFDIASKYALGSPSFDKYTSESLDFEGKSLELFTGGSGDVTLIFEHGLGDTGEVWFGNGLLSKISNSARFIAYSRSGMGNSTSNGDIRSMENISKDLNAIIENKVTTNKVILVGHSWGGTVIRYFAVNYPNKVDALLFIDPTAEWDWITQEEEDNVVQYYNNNGGLGAAAEAEQIFETKGILESLPNLPDIPTVLLSSKDLSQFDVNVQTNIRNGVTDFIHVVTTHGHYIYKDRPALVHAHLNNLVTKVKTR